MNLQRGAPHLFPAVVLCIGAISGCEPENRYVPPPPPDVTVSVPDRRPITSYAAYTGTTQATESVDLRARVKGFLVRINFKPADNVKKGDLLFEIDPKPFQAQVDLYVADLANKVARSDEQESEYRRTAALYQKKVVSEEEYNKAKATRDGAKAAVDGAKASLESARLDLGYCKVFAPISGRISRNLVNVGNLVGDGQATLLATIYDEDPIYVYVTVSESDLLRFRKQVSEGKRVDYRKHPIPMWLGLTNETGYPHEGRLDYADPSVDPSTGTLQAHGIFPNADSAIVPGLFARIRVALEENPDALLVPERALGADQSGRFVLVVNKDNVVEQRKVTVGAEEGEFRVIETGLKPDDRVIVNGLQRARPDEKVNPKLVEPAAPAAKTPQP